MPSPVSQRTFEDLDKMHKIKLSLEKLDQLRDEFLRESSKVRAEESFLSEVTVERQELERDKMVLTEEMKAVNSDINRLDDAAKQSESEKKHAYEKAQRLLAEMHKLRNEVNYFRGELQQELLPENIVDPGDEAKFLPPMAAHLWSGSVAAESSFHSTMMGFAGLPNEDYPRAVDFSVFPNVAVNNAAAAAVVQETSNSGGNFGKQPTPMKTCAGCQEQIHRNAPICPHCKSKSRSRNPKKPKQRRLEDHS